MRLIKVVLLIVLAPIWLPHYLALMAVGVMLVRSLEWSDTLSRGGTEHAERGPLPRAMSNQSTAEAPAVDAV